MSDDNKISKWWYFRAVALGVYPPALLIEPAYRLTAWGVRAYVRSRGERAERERAEKELASKRARDEADARAAADERRRQEEGQAAMKRDEDARKAEALAEAERWYAENEKALRGKFPRARFACWLNQHMADNHTSAQCYEALAQLIDEQQPKADDAVREAPLDERLGAAMEEFERAAARIEALAVSDELKETLKTKLEGLHEETLLKLLGG